jgi:hypothetical protein
MEDGQNQEVQTPEVPQETVTPPSTGVSFPTVGEPKKSGGAKTLLIIGVLILVGILGFVIYKSAAGKNGANLNEPTPFDNLTPDQGTSVITPAPSSTPAAIDRTTVKIQVENGTGITGEAAYLQTQLKGLGYTLVTTGNSTQQNLTATQVSFANSLSSDIVTEITTKLNSIYQSVTTTTSLSTTYDVVIITGLRKGATAKPSATPTAKPSATPTASPSASPTPTATP